MDPFTKPESFIPKPKAIAGLYTVRLTVEGMKHQIEQCLLDHDGTLRATVEKEIESAVAQFDFTKEVKSIAQSVMQTLVTQALERSIRDAFTNPVLVGGMNELVMATLLTIIKERR